MFADEVTQFHLLEAKQYFFPVGKIFGFSELFKDQ